MKKGNPHPVKNYSFPKAPQNLDEQKSKGKINARKALNILFDMRTEVINRDIVSKTMDNIENELEMGFVKNAIKVLDIVKEPEAQEIKFDNETIVNIIPVKNEDKS